MKMKTYKGKKVVTTVDEYEFNILACSAEEAVDLLNGESVGNDSISYTHGGVLMYSNCTVEKPKSKARVVNNILNATEIDTDITIEEYKINK